ncbi:MAG: Branched-chain amino acid aminotransferase [Pseudomonadota bacterium]|jgi:large conductance mechanosensitive channel
MFEEFRRFIARGNVVDLAVGLIVGAAFTAIVNSLVGDILNPLIGVVTGGIDFSNHFVNLGRTEFATLAEARAAGAPVIAWGAFLTALINFLIVAWAVFLLVKAVNRLRDAATPPPPPAQPAGPPAPTSEELLAEIRDLLRARG